jgi:hypothetical protein
MIRRAGRCAPSTKLTGRAQRAPKDARRARSGWAPGWAARGPIRETARYRDSYAKGRARQPDRRGCDSRGDNESWRDADALRLALVRVTPALQRQAPRSQARKPPREPRRRLWVHDRDSRPTTERPDQSGLCAFRDADVHRLSSHDDGRASRAPLRQKPFPRDWPQQWKGAVPPPVQA